MKSYLLIIFYIFSMNIYGQKNDIPYYLSSIKEFKLDKSFINPVFSPDRAKLLFKKNDGLMISDFELNIFDTVVEKTLYINNYEWLTDSTLRYREINKDGYFIYNINSHELKTYRYLENEIFFDYTGLYSKIKKYEDGKIITLIPTDSFTPQLYLSPNKKYALAYQPPSNKHYYQTIIYDLESRTQIKKIDNSIPSGWLNNSENFIYYRLTKENENYADEKVIESDLFLADIHNDKVWNLTSDNDLIETCSYIRDNFLIVRDLKDKRVFLYKIERK